jgi:hypothetical protein
MKRKTDKRVRRGSLTDQLYKTMAALLKTKHWTVVVAGPCTIETGGPLKYNYRFVVDFTGIKKDAGKAATA